MADADTEYNIRIHRAPNPTSTESENIEAWGVHHFKFHALLGYQPRSSSAPPSVHHLAEITLLRSMAPRVPVEVAERAIDQLADDHRSLRNCALVCRQWLPRTRLYLFREVVLTTYQQLYMLCSILQSTSTLRHLVQVVRVDMGKELINTQHPLLPSQDDISRPSPTLGFCHICDSVVLALLPYLPSVRRIHLGGLPTQQHIISLTMRSITLATLRRYSLIDELRLSYLYFDSAIHFSRVLLAFPSL